MKAIWERLSHIKVWKGKYVITTRVRCTREGNVFSLFVCSVGVRVPSGP